MPLNDRQRELVGSWTQISVENNDPFLKKIGIGLFLRGVAKVQKPTIRLEYDDETNTWHQFIESAFKNHDWKFTPSVRYKQTTIDGRKFWATMTMAEDGSHLEIQETCEEEPKNIPCVVKRFIEDGKLIILEECDGVVSKRVLKRAD